MGYRKTKKDVLSIVQTTLMRKAEEEGKQFLKNVLQGWWVKFCNRWPQIGLQKGDPFQVALDQVTTYAVFKDYLISLKKHFLNMT